MCLILFAYDTHPQYRLVLAANRDEFYARPTAPLGYWKDHPQLLAGRDLQQMGTWLGITKDGRCAAVTNYREPDTNPGKATSRGHLVSDYLLGNGSPRAYLKELSTRSKQYQGFNLIVGDAGKLHYFSNRSRHIQSLPPGIYGLSNHLLNTAWPKVARGKALLADALQVAAEIEIQTLIELLQNQEGVSDHQLPKTGVDLTWERILAPIFITSPTYGTRSSSILTIDRAGRTTFCEQTWQPAQTAPRAIDLRCFDFTIGSSANTH